jgi:hypothetical protein
MRLLLAWPANNGATYAHIAIPIVTHVTPNTPGWPVYFRIFQISGDRRCMMLQASRVICPLCEWAISLRYAGPVA